MSDPPIALFCCRNALPALAPLLAELSGAAVVELPCSGRIDEVALLRTLRQGAYAVLVVGCLEGNCKYHSGNYQARRRMDEVRSILEQIGVEPQRVHMVNLASNQQAKLRTAINATKERAERLGPIMLLEGER